MNDLYTFSAGVFGLTPCSPIVKYYSNGEVDFKAALCLDTLPSGNLNNYFEFRSDTDDQTYMLFNDDPDASLNESLLASDSNFHAFLKQII